jgi:hypothetical protein
MYVLPCNLQALVGEHGSAIARALTLMASLVGTPAAQVLWVQVRHATGLMCFWQGLGIKGKQVL